MAARYREIGFASDEVTRRSASSERPMRTLPRMQRINPREPIAWDAPVMVYSPRIVVPTPPRPSSTVQRSFARREFARRQRMIAEQKFAEQRRQSRINLIWLLAIVLAFVAFGVWNRAHHTELGRKTKTYSLCAKRNISSDGFSRRAIERCQKRLEARESLPFGPLATK